MSEHYFTIPKDAILSVAKGDDAWTEIGATSIGVDAQPGQPVRLEIIEGRNNHHRVLDTKARDKAHPFRLVYPCGKARLFLARIVSSATEGKALVSTIEIEGTVDRLAAGQPSHAREQQGLPLTADAGAAELSLSKTQLSQAIGHLGGDHHAMAAAQLAQPVEFISSEVFGRKAHLFRSPNQTTGAASAESLAARGVDANFSGLPRTGAGRHARDLPEMGL